MVYPVPALAIGLCIVLTFLLNRRRGWLSIVLVALAATTLLPNSTLPNHLVSEYGWLGVLLLAAPTVVAATLLPSGARMNMAAWALAVVLCALCLKDYRRPDFEGAWLRNQERIQGAFLRTMPILHDGSSAARRNLVFGITSPFDVFRTPVFVLTEFGAGQWWTVVVPDSVAELTVATTRLVHASTVPDDEYDRLIVYNGDNILTGLYGADALDTLRKAGRLPIPIHLVPLDPASVFGKSGFFARPNPILLAPADHSGLGTTSLSWSFPWARKVEIHVDSRNGPLLGRGAATGTIATGKWVRNGMVFYLQDASQRTPTSPQNTLATVSVVVIDNEPAKPHK
jgi:hypothetical protein